MCQMRLTTRTTLHSSARAYRYTLISQSRVASETIDQMMGKASAAASTPSKVPFCPTCQVRTSSQGEKSRVSAKPYALPVRFLTSLVTMASVISMCSAAPPRFIGSKTRRKFTTSAFLSCWVVPFQLNQRRRMLLYRLHSSLASQPRNESKKHSLKIQLQIPTPQDMEDVGAVLSMGTGPGDVILLGGDLGAGKTTISRGFIRSRTGSIDMKVTSPTYLLSNTYEADRGDTIIHHMDLYRLSGKDDDLSPLDMDNALTKCISLIEWPSRLGDAKPSVRLDVNIHIDLDDESSDNETKTRYLTLQPHGMVWEDRLKLLVDEGLLDDLLLEDKTDGNT